MTACMTVLKPLWTMPRTKKSEVCPHCRGAGVELVNEAHPEMYPNKPSGEPAAPVEFAVPCRVCKGRRKDYEEETRKRLDLPYCHGLSAFNPSAYLDEKGNIISFQKEYAFIKKYVENYKEVENELEIKGLYIHSPIAGNGKTFLASCICFEMYTRHQLMPCYIRESNLLDRLQATVSDTQISPREQIQRAPILFIDDMWRKITGREWLNDELFNIIDYRYTHKLPMIITSNVSLDSDKIDTRIASRLNTMCAPIMIPGIEIRTKELQEKRKKLFDALTKGKTEDET